jgi:hypothetical protein
MLRMRFHGTCVASRGRGLAFDRANLTRASGVSSNVAGKEKLILRTPAFLMPDRSCNSGKSWFVYDRIVVDVRRPGVRPMIETHALTQVRRSLKTPGTAFPRGDLARYRALIFFFLRGKPNRHR